MRTEVSTWQIIFKGAVSRWYSKGEEMNHENAKINTL